jgi:hypothetical protein
LQPKTAEYFSRLGIAAEDIPRHVARSAAIRRQLLEALCRLRQKLILTELEVSHHTTARSLGRCPHGSRPRGEVLSSDIHSIERDAEVATADHRRHLAFIQDHMATISARLHSATQVTAPRRAKLSAEVATAPLAKHFARQVGQNRHVRAAFGGPHDQDRSRSLPHSP